MQKRIKKWGNSLVLIITSQEADVYGLKEGDIIEIDDMLWEKLPKKRIKKEVN